MNIENKNIFASYLEETAAEIRAFKLCREYLDDMGSSLIKHITQFCNEQFDILDKEHSKNYN